MSTPTRLIHWEVNEIRSFWWWKISDFLHQNKKIWERLPICSIPECREYLWWIIEYIGNKQPFSRHNWRLAYVINVIIAMTSNKPEEIIENRLLFKNKVWKCIVYVFVAKIINWFQPNNFHKITWVKLCTKGNFFYKKIEPIYFCTLVLSMSLH